jgi:F-type H+-transporting ATPase subunit gamma
MSLLKLRSRLRTVKSLNSIFSALQVVTVVRTQRIREKYRAMERYLGPVVGVLRGRGQKGRKTWDVGRSGGKVLIVITSNRGLCGNFNKVVVTEAEKFLQANPGTKVVALGKMGGQHLSRQCFKLEQTGHLLVEKPTFDNVAIFFHDLLTTDSEIFVTYNSYKSTAVQIPKTIKLTPVPAELESEQEPVDYLFEPAKATVIPTLYQHYLTAKLFQIILESQMGELGARLMVLKGAVDTSKEMITDIQLSINKARQAAITGDLLEIVSAAEAVRESYE